MHIRPSLKRALRALLLGSTLAIALAATASAATLAQSQDWPKRSTMYVLRADAPKVSVHGKSIKFVLRGVPAKTHYRSDVKRRHTNAVGTGRMVSEVRKAGPKQHDMRLYTSSAKSKDAYLLKVKTIQRRGKTLSVTGRLLSHRRVPTIAGDRVRAQATGDASLTANVAGAPPLAAPPLSEGQTINGCQIAVSSECTNANLAGADLSGLDLSQMDFEGANLRNANLSNTTINQTTFVAANLSGANLSGATSICDETTDPSCGFVVFGGQGLSFSEGNLQGLTASGAKFVAGNFTEAKLDGSIFANTSFGEGQFEQASMTGIQTTGGDFEGTSWNEVAASNARMTGTNFANAALDQVQFNGAVLSGLGFSNTGLSYIDFSGADISGSNFGGAYMSNVTLNGTKLPDSPFVVH